jgi:hypothetical protein
MVGKIKFFVEANINWNKRRRKNIEREIEVKIINRVNLQK